MKFKENFHGYAIITIIGWSLAYPLTRLTLNYFSAFSLGFLRYLIASIGLLFIVIFMKIKAPKMKDIPWYFLSGAIGFFLYMITFNTGTKYVSAATSSVIIATAPIITSILAKVIFREQLKLYQWIAVGIEFIGIIIITLISGGGFSINIGVIWLIGASLLLACYNIIQRKLVKEYSSIQVAAYSIFFGTIMLAIFAPVSINYLKNAPKIQLLYLLILGVFSSAIAYLSWTKAFVKAKNTSQVSNYMFTTPILSGVFGFILAGEIPGISTIVGGIVIISGFLLFNKKNFAKQDKGRGLKWS